MNLKRWAYKLHRTWVAKACRCGDEAHHNLEKWYEKYSGNEPIDPWEMAMFERLNSRDKFDRAVLEEQIQKVSLQNPVINGYCPSCQRLLDEWPEIIQKVPVSDSPYPGDPYRHPHYSCTPEFEAGYRNGCQLCTKFVQFWKIDGYLFEDWHKKENRLNSLGKSTIISLFVRKAFGAITLILTWPGTSYDSCKYHSLSFCDSSDGRMFLYLEVLWNQAYKCQNDLIREKTHPFSQPMGTFRKLSWQRNGLKYVQKNTRLANQLRTTNCLPD